MVAFKSLAAAFLVGSGATSCGASETNLKRQNPRPASEAAEARQTLDALHLMEGFPDGTLRGRKSITRYTLLMTLRSMMLNTPRFETAHPDAVTDSLLEIFSPRAPVTSTTFLDLSGTNWSNTLGQAEYLKSKGLVTGNPDGFFRGKRAVTRAELATVAAALLQRVEPKPTLDLKRANFRDLNGGEWYFGSALIAAGSEIMRGYPDHTFRPKSLVSQDEMAFVLARLLKKTTRETPSGR